MIVAEAQNTWKTFNGLAAVQDVSFTVESGDVLGLVGPNGAGKTTTIRMLLDIIQPDEGRVLLFGRSFANEHRAMLGYLPEERGLYRDLRVGETLEYLGSLKGLSREDAKRRTGEVLERLDIAENRDKKVKELSRGNAQLIGLAATILHEPKLLVLDEPFSGLDPVNVRLVKEVLAELREQGVGLILSTHQMNQVEELCDRVLMLNGGRVVLYDQLEEIRSGFGSGSVIVEGSRIPEQLAGVKKAVDHGTYRELVMSEGASGSTVLKALAETDADVRRFQIAGLPLEEIFIRIVRSADQ